MGCAQAKPDVNDINPRMFHVLNVDDHGREVNEGFIEISDNELILLQKNREPIKWPLKCLRRYGFETELFSFESGRRCPTGPGIFAFKCQRAELLFNTLQDCIQMAGQQEDRQHFSSSHSRPESVSSHSPDTGGRNDEILRDTVYINGAARQSQPPRYMNTVPQASNRHALQSSHVRVSVVNNSSVTNHSHTNGHTINYAVLDLPRSAENLFELEPAQSPTCNGTTKTKYADIDVDKLNPVKNNPPSMPMAGASSSLAYADLDHSASAAATVYMNVTSDRDSPLSSHSRSICAEDQRMYCNVDLNGAASAAYHTLPAGAPHSVEATVNRINYIELDLDNGSDTGQTHSPTSLTFPESPTKRTDMYASIDFNRTAALSNSTKASGIEDSEGFQRKTRHDSTINELP